MFPEEVSKLKKLMKNYISDNCFYSFIKLLEEVCKEESEYTSVCVRDCGRILKNLDGEG